LVVFSLSQVIDAPPAEVVRAFTEPVPFAAWFVAEGFSTPADRVSIDVRPGGLISAVFVADEGEVPFTLQFGELDLPHHLVIHLDGPAEVVNVHFKDLGDGRTRLDYDSEGLPADQETTIKPGVARMLGYTADYFG
jgi:uncharacterized protein YndB with AHSA1/START domain